MKAIYFTFGVILLLALFWISWTIGNNRRQKKKYEAEEREYENFNKELSEKYRHNFKK